MHFGPASMQGHGSVAMGRTIYNGILCLCWAQLGGKVPLSSVRPTIGQVSVKVGLMVPFVLCIHHTGKVP